MRRTWKRIIAGECGIVSTKPLGPEFAALPSQVAGLVPEGTGGDGLWNAEDFVTPTELRQTAKFAQFGLAASAEALEDAGFKDGVGLDSEMAGVCLGSGIGNLEELYNTSIAYGEGKNYRKIHPLFVSTPTDQLGSWTHIDEIRV